MRQTLGRSLQAPRRMATATMRHSLGRSLPAPRRMATMTMRHSLGRSLLAPRWLATATMGGDASPSYECRAAPAPGSPFHHAFPVHSLASARAFYGGVLGCEEGRTSDKWIGAWRTHGERTRRNARPTAPARHAPAPLDFALHGHQIVAHWVGDDYRCRDFYNPVDGDGARARGVRARARMPQSAGARARARPRGAPQRCRCRTLGSRSPSSSGAHSPSACAPRACRSSSSRRCASRACPASSTRCSSKIRPATTSSARAARAVRSAPLRADVRRARVGAPAQVQGDDAPAQPVRKVQRGGGLNRRRRRAHGPARDRSKTCRRCRHRCWRGPDFASTPCPVVGRP